MKARLQARHCRGIPEILVDSRWRIELIQNLSRLVGDRTNRSWRVANRAMALAARDAARKSESHLFLYEPYAWEAFTANYSHNPLKILFHFHLHPHFERELIAQDQERHPPSKGKWHRNDAQPKDDERVVDAWRHADLVLCASSFTKRSLTSQGMPSEKGVVIPYGIDVAATTTASAVPKQFDVLFVGSGIQRKGLHHLFRAWVAARLPKTASLTLVCRTVDPVLESMLKKAPANVRVLNGVSSAELTGLFRKSALFVLPSLLEGFGQVFLEALSQGCPVLGTPNTCLPDLGTESDGVFLVEAGDPDRLRERLEELSGKLIQPEQITIRRNAAALAGRFTWPLFRANLIEAIRGVSSSP